MGGRRAAVPVRRSAPGRQALPPRPPGQSLHRPAAWIQPLWRSIAEGDWVFAGMDLGLWAWAGLHAVLALRTARHRAPVPASGTERAAYAERATDPPETSTA